MTFGTNWKQCYLEISAAQGSAARGIDVILITFSCAIFKDLLQLQLQHFDKYRVLYIMSLFNPIDPKYILSHFQANAW